MVTTSTLKFWNPCHFVYKRISLTFEIVRNWRSTSTLRSHNLPSLWPSSNFSQETAIVTGVLLGSTGKILPSREHYRWLLILFFWHVGVKLQNINEKGNLKSHKRKKVLPLRNENYITDRLCISYQLLPEDSGMIFSKWKGEIITNIAFYT